jgi:hypothetical protein
MHIEHRLGISSAIALLVGLCGCASIPKVSRTYYFPIAQQDTSIIQTIGCVITPVNKTLNIAANDADKATTDKDKKGNKPPPGPVYTSTGPYSTATATVTTTYIADYGSSHTLRYKDVDSRFGDSDISVGVTDDGRLSSINAAGTGEGAAIIKAAATIASVATANKVFNEGIAPPMSDACKMIQTYGSASDKAPTVFTLTLNYKLRVQYRFNQEDWGVVDEVNTTATGDVQPLKDEIVVVAQDGTTSTKRWNSKIPIPLNSGANPVSDDQVAAYGGNFTFTARRVSSGSSSVHIDPALQPTWTNDGTASLDVPSLANLNIAVEGPTADMKKTADFYNDYVLVPSSTALKVPVPKAPVFGKIAMTAQFGASGAVEKLEYNKATAMTDLINSGAQIYNQIQPETAAQKAAGVQAQADLIYQQQRLITCQLDPNHCASK